MLTLFSSCLVLVGGNTKRLRLKLQSLAARECSSSTNRLSRVLSVFFANRPSSFGLVPGGNVEGINAAVCE